MFFYGMTTNLNWEILTKNLVTFKRWDGGNDEKFYYHGVHWKIQFLGSGGHEKPIYRGGNCLKRGLGQFANLRGAWQKRGGGVFEADWYPNEHYGLLQDFRCRFPT